MVQLKPPGKAYEIAKKVLKQKGIKVPPRESMQQIKLKGPYLQH